MTAREASSGMATGRVFPETDVGETDPEGGGMAIGEEGGQRTGQPLGSAAYARGAGLDPDPGPAAATNLNSSRSNIYRTGGGGAPTTEDEASEAPIPGKPSKEQRMKAGLDTTGGALASGAARASDEGDAEDAARLSRKLPIGEPREKSDFGG